MNHALNRTWAEHIQALTISSAKDMTYISRGGAIVYDLFSGNLAAAFGQSHPSIIAAVKKQLDVMPVACAAVAFDLKTNTSQRLIQFLGFNSGTIYYKTSEYEVAQLAVNFARQASGKKLILTRRQSATQLFAATKDMLQIPEPSTDPYLYETRRFIEEMGPGNIAAFFLESVTARTDVVIPSTTWWNGIQALCDEFNILLILDEMTCGFGRTGEKFAFEHFPQLSPHFVCMARAITGGYIPFGVLWASNKIEPSHDPDEYAHPLGLAATNAVLDLWEDEAFIQQKRNLEIAFANELRTINTSNIAEEVLHLGLLAGLRLRADLKLDRQRALERGVHVGINADAQVVVLAPPLIMHPSELSSAMSNLASALI